MEKTDRQLTKLRDQGVKVLHDFGYVKHLSKVYRLTVVQTHDKQSYYNLSLFMDDGKFIKQFYFELELLSAFIRLLRRAELLKEV